MPLENLDKRHVNTPQAGRTGITPLIAKTQKEQARPPYFKQKRRKNKPDRPVLNKNAENSNTGSKNAEKSNALTEGKHRNYYVVFIEFTRW